MISLYFSLEFKKRHRCLFGSGRCLYCQIRYLFLLGYIYLSVSLETYLHSPSIYSMFFTSAVFREGDEGTSWYIILRGSVNLMVGKKVCLNCVYISVIYNGI